VVDTTPPTLALSLSPVTLWPPNGRMVRILATVTAEDLCGDAEIRLQSITSSDPIAPPVPRGSRGSPDIRGADPGSPDFDFMLRAERAGADTGRVYTITYCATDSSGNVAAASSPVTVPHDRRPNRIPTPDP
jgi:hypothetical protein